MIKGKTVIFLDEVQVCSNIITAIKFLVSEGSYRYILSGSLLGTELKDIKSIPVGYMSTFQMFPLDFEEFLDAIGEEKLKIEIKKHYESCVPLLDCIHDKAIDLYKKYLILGGMPSIIKDFINKNMKITEVNFDIQEQIITSYLADMNKYTENSEGIKNSKIYNSIPKELV